MTLHSVLLLVQAMALIPAVGGAIYAILCVYTMMQLRKRIRAQGEPSSSFSPPVTLLKPVHGLDKNLRENLRSACLQDYPSFQVILSAQRIDDPAIPLLREIQEEFGKDRVTVVVDTGRAGTNGKINNMIGALKHARHDMLVISDSDVLLRPDYLKTIVAPLADPEVGFVCTLYKAAGADKWYEKMELLTLNADLMTNVIFAYVTGAAKFCLGASTALRRQTLDQIGGLPALADYLVEDFEMGRRILNLGKRNAIIPYFVDTIMDLHTPAQWWKHQVYWDQNNRAARPLAFFATILLRSIPFALLFALLRSGDRLGWAVFSGAVLIRLVTAAINLGRGLSDREGLRSLYLLPLRDISALVSFILSYTQRTTVWREGQFTLTRDGRLIAQVGG